MTLLHTLIVLPAMIASFDTITRLAYTIVTALIFAIGLIFGIKQWRSQKAITLLQEKMYNAENKIADSQEETAKALKKTAELQVFVHLFKLLSDLELSKSRGIIFVLYCRVYGKDPSDNQSKREELLKLYKDIQDHIRKVEGAFDQAGVLVIKGQVDKILFLELYALMVIRTYRALKAHIYHDRADICF